MNKTRMLQARAWGVHIYTATGGVIGMFALFSAAAGNTRQAFFLLVLSMIIDATDGIMARRFKVRTVLPHFDGAMVDNVIDMLTFVWIPIFIMWQEALLPATGWLIIPMLAGLYAYGQVNMKTPDNFFLGFPCYWNIIALYLFWLQPPGIIAILLLIIPAILTFIPTRYLYPSKNYVFWQITWAAGVVWFVMIFVLLGQDVPNQLLVKVSLFYPAYYMLMSFYIEWRVRYAARMEDVTGSSPVQPT